MAQGLSRFTWKALGLVGGIAASTAARKLTDKAWKRTRGGEPPRNPASRTTTWPEALAWAVVSGTAVAIARLLEARAAAAAWEKTTGHLPPGLEEVGA